MTNNWNCCQLLHFLNYILYCNIVRNLKNKAKKKKKKKKIKYLGLRYFNISPYNDN